MRFFISAFVLVTVIFLIVVNMFGALVLGKILENAVGAPVSVGRLHFGIFSSSAGLYNVEIKNPNGFSEKTLAVIREISAKYDLGSFFRRKIHLKEIRLDFGDVTIEKRSGKINLLELGAVRGITKGIGSGSDDSKSGKPGAQKAPGIQMDEVYVNMGKARYVDSSMQTPAVKEYDLGIHDETFKHVTNTQSLVKDIAFLVLRKVGMSSLTSNFDILLKGVGGGVQSTVQKLLTS